MGGRGGGVEGDGGHLVYPPKDVKKLGDQKAMKQKNM